MGLHSSTLCGGLAARADCGALDGPAHGHSLSLVRCHKRPTCHKLICEHTRHWALSAMQVADAISAIGGGLAFDVGHLSIRLVCAVMAVLTGGVAAVWCYYASCIWRQDQAGKTEKLPQTVDRFESQLTARS